GVSGLILVVAAADGSAVPPGLTTHFWTSFPSTEVLGYDSGVPQAGLKGRAEEQPISSLKRH
ncbi:MAG: hypothetical protein ACREJ2_14660, partial [Planctomycetota bacterium]